MKMALKMPFIMGQKIASASIQSDGQVSTEILIAIELAGLMDHESSKKVAPHGRLKGSNRAFFKIFL